MNSSAKLNVFSNGDLSRTRLPVSTVNSLRSQGFHYLWAVGTNAAQKLPGTQIASRYQVVAPQIWLDTQPEYDPEVPNGLRDAALPYLYLYPYRLHVPEVYGICRDPETNDEILLLENVPLTENGQLQSSIVASWHQTSAVRQVYWLWQILELWTPCSKLGVESSLLSPDNIRVEGWRIRLKQLIWDEDDSHQFEPPTLAHLAKCWLIWVLESKPVIADSLRGICAQMQADDANIESISAQLNHLLLQQAASLPFRLQVYGATDVGRMRSHNEDTCYPLTTKSQPYDDLAPRLTIVCDGIGGHEGGEVASQLAVQSLQLQIRALLAEISEQPEPVSPELLCEQLAAIVRVVNNMIAAQNDAQQRQSRRRMGTTLVMALQIPQRVKMAGGAIALNAHELYIANVGDSRAYWITPNYCHQLTVDDDVAVREVRMGRSLYRNALKQPNSGALTQALGTRDGNSLYPSVRRLIVEEDGLLVLCSDGMSDNGFVEQSWADYAELVLRDRFPLETAVQSWLEFANQRNGHDNASIIVTHCQVSSSLPELRVSVATLDRVENEPEDDLPEPIVIPPPEPEKPRRQMGWLKVLLLLILGGAAGVGLWYSFDSPGVERLKHDVRNQIGPLRIPTDLFKR
jgi:protein phosphatase